tara:strand:+ start:11140 stop:11325 length:186 start_codon:yes stop_codon:yes gene_type:complete
MFKKSYWDNYFVDFHLDELERRQEFYTKQIDEWYFDKTMPSFTEICKTLDRIERELKNRKE